MVQAGIGRDFVQPGPEIERAHKGVQRAPGAQERLLHQVLGVVQRAQHAIAVHQQLAAIGLAQQLKRLLVAGFGSGQLVGIDAF
jgi:hypothetical protein